MFIQVGKVGALGRVVNEPEINDILYILFQKSTNYKGDPSQFLCIDSESFSLVDNEENNIWIGSETSQWSEKYLSNYILDNFNEDSTLSEYSIIIKDINENILGIEPLDNFGYCNININPIPSDIKIEIIDNNNFLRKKDIHLGINNYILLFDL